jgi:hypothetical protein
MYETYITHHFNNTQSFTAGWGFIDAEHCSTGFHLQLYYRIRFAVSLSDRYFIKVQHEHCQQRPKWLLSC